MPTLSIPSMPPPTWAGFWAFCAMLAAPVAALLLLALAARIDRAIRRTPKG